MTNSALQLPPDDTEAFGEELPPGSDLCGGQYRIERFLNSGGFGITYRARDSLGRIVVIKECFPGAMCCRVGQGVRPRTQSYEEDFEKVLALFQTEAQALARLQHPNIVGVHQIFQDNGTAYMALDYIDGPDLMELIESDPDRFDRHEIKRILTRLLDALSYVHENGVLHRDISPDNILIDQDGSPVLIDFGAARENASRASKVLSRLLTVKDGYSPQEFYLAGSAQGKSSDLYALAATMHHLITGAAPPNSHLRLAAVAENRPDPYKPLQGRVRGYDHHFLDAIDRCLALFPKDRLNTADDWLDRIDDDRRRRLLREKARQDKDIDRRVSELVAEFRKTMAQMPPEEPARKNTALQQPLLRRRRRDEKPPEYWAILSEPREPDPEPASAPEPEPVEQVETPQAQAEPAGGEGVEPPLADPHGGNRQTRADILTTSFRRLVRWAGDPRAVRRGASGRHEAEAGP